DEDARVWIREQVRKAIWGTLAVLYGPHPAVFAVGPALAKTLRFEPDDLIEQIAFVVRVVVCRNNARLGWRLALDRLHSRRERFRDRSRAGATAMAIAFAIRLEGGQAGLLADVVLAGDIVVTGEAVHQESVRRAGVERHHHAAVLGRMSRSGRSDLIAIHLAAERARNLLQAWKLHNECSPKEKVASRRHWRRLALLL